MTQPDDDLRSRFERLRGDLEQEGTPSFGAMMERARADAARVESEPVSLPARRRWLVAGGWASAAVAAALAGVLLTRDRPDPADAEFERLVASFAADASAGAWRSPTDALLDVPGSDLMRSMPAVGGGVPDLAFPELPDLDRPGDSL